ncbi:protocatechuate 3 4-dioxygenase beta subunit [Fusarium beomiforme]|uniref:Protocatechuate 3 4-dioxygenase beta subunit n=1 Tax=Fusarium beomiforme TaxID=44412 RepID=A0A9P5DQ73_9HYPO|nr:protocatechuate 3 4-dioxygenase beta subunit [Fusarium beomiforme]
MTGLLAHSGPTRVSLLVGWLAYGINITTTEKVTPAVFRYEDGGHTNPNFGGGPGGPGGPQPPGASKAEDTTSDTA